MKDDLIPLDDVVIMTGIQPSYLRKQLKNNKIRGKRVNGIQCLEWSSVRGLIKERKMGNLFELSDLEVDIPPTLPKPNPVYSIDEIRNNIFNSSSIEFLRSLQDKSIQTAVFSSPYWAQTAYEGDQETLWMDGTTCALGLEKDPMDFVRHLLEIMNELKRVLKDDGTAWCNIGDSYFTHGRIRPSTRERIRSWQGKEHHKWKDYPHKKTGRGHEYFKDKDLTLTPFLFATGVQRLGYYLRSTIIWKKTYVAPEPDWDRPTPYHEYIFMFSKSHQYKYRNENLLNFYGDSNLGTVWEFSVSTQHGNHVAAYPLDLPRRCILASTDVGDLVLDIFMGSGTTAIAADELGRDFTGCDIHQGYVDESKERLRQEREKRGDLTFRADGTAELTRQYSLFEFEGMNTVPEVSTEQENIKP